MYEGQSSKNRTNAITLLILIISNKDFFVEQLQTICSVSEQRYQFSIKFLEIMTIFLRLVSETPTEENILNNHRVCMQILFFLMLHNKLMNLLALK